MWRRGIIGLAVLVLGMGQAQAAQQMPSLANPGVLHLDQGMAELSAPQLRSIVEQSPLFLAELDHDSLIAAPETPLRLAEGVDLDLSNYLRNTQISAQPVAALAINSPQALGVSGTPQLVEEVFVLEDRIIVSREVTLQVTAQTCSVIAPQEPAQDGPRTTGIVALARSELCLRPPSPERPDRLPDQQPVLLDPAQSLTGIGRDRVQTGPQGSTLLLPPTQADIAQEAEDIRDELRQRRPSERYRHQVTVREALRLADDELIRLDADGDERVITHVSIIPLAQPVRETQAARRLPDAALPDQDDFAAPIGPRLDQLPSVLRPHQLTRQGGRRPLRRITNRVEGLTTPQVGPAEQPQLRGLNPGAEGLRAAIDPNVLRPGRDEDFGRVQVQTIRQTGNAYFITGFTLREEIEERHKVTFNKRRNYFVAFKYRVGYQAGLRFPFAVDYAAETLYRTERRSGAWAPLGSDFTVSATGVDGDARGIYAAAGMPGDLIANDREMTFGVWAWCQLQVRLPVVKTVRVNCPSISVPRANTCPNWACSDFTPPLGRERQIASPRIPADISGLQINAWVARAGVEPGVNVYARNAEFSLRAEPLSGSSFDATPNRRQSCEQAGRGLGDVNILLEDGACRLVFPMESDTPMQLSLLAERRDIPGLRLSDPVYAFTMAFVPVLELFAEVDVAVASWRVDKDIEIPGLTIRRDFRFDRHPGTTESVTLGGCHPSDRNNSGCSSEQGYRFGPIRTQRADAPG